MNPLEDFKLFWTNYTNFNGRTPRRGYWFVFLEILVIYIVLFWILLSSGSSSLYSLLRYGTLSSSGGVAGFVTVLIILLSLALIIPFISLTIRRLHDTGRKWYWILFPYIPVAISTIGSFFLSASVVNARSMSDLSSLISSTSVFGVIMVVVNVAFEIAWIAILASATSSQAIGISTHNKKPESSFSPGVYSASPVGTPVVPSIATPMVPPPDAASSTPPIAVSAALSGASSAVEERVREGVESPAVHRTGAIFGISGTYEGTTFPANSGEKIVIGRDSTFSHIVIDRDAEKVSRKHVSVLYDCEQNIYYVRDYSSNGTFKEDGSRLVADKDVALPPGTVLNLGKTSNSFKLG